MVAANGGGPYQIELTDSGFLQMKQEFVGPFVKSPFFGNGTSYVPLLEELVGFFRIKAQFESWADMVADFDRIYQTVLR